MLASIVLNGSVGLSRRLPLWESSIQENSIQRHGRIRIQTGDYINKTFSAYLALFIWLFLFLTPFSLNLHVKDRKYSYKNVFEFKLSMNLLFLGSDVFPSVCVYVASTSPKLYWRKRTEICNENLSLDIRA